MTVEGVDFSYDHPSVAGLAAAGKQFACRYLTGTTSANPGSKNLTPTEAQALQAAGIDIVSNYETSVGFMLEGYDSGAKRAEAAWRQHKWCGGPDRAVIYWSLDMNATYDQWKQAREFLKGAASVLGWDRTGMYGGLFQVDWAHDELGMRWLWQALGWSYGQVSPHIVLRQWKNGVALAGGTVDLDRALAADYGQWATTKEAFVWTDAEQDRILRAADQILGAVGAGQTSYSGTVEATLATVQGLVNLVKGAQGALAGNIDSTRSAILGAIAALPPPTGGVDPAVVADQIVTALEQTGVQVNPDAVLDALAQRLAA